MTLKSRGCFDADFGIYWPWDLLFDEKSISFPKKQNIAFRNVFDFKYLASGLYSFCLVMTGLATNPPGKATLQVFSWKK